MQLIFNARASDPAEALVQSTTGTLPAVAPVFVAGDDPLIQLYVGDGLGGYDSDSGSASVTPWLGIGDPNAEPDGGTFWLGVSSATSGSLQSGSRYQIQTYVAGDDFTNVGADSNASGVIFTKTNGSPTNWTNGSTLIEITTDIAYNATAATVQTALIATYAISANGVTVTKPTSAAIYVVEWTAAAVQPLMTGGGGDLTPSSSVVVAEIQTGSASVKERQLVRLVQTPAALQFTWAQITNGWQARLDCDTAGIYNLLAGATSIATRLELQLIDGDGHRRTVGQVNCVVRGQVVDESSTLPVTLPSYYTAAQVDALVRAIYRDSTQGTKIEGVTETTIATVNCPVLGEDDELVFSGIFTRDSGQNANTKLNIYHEGNAIGTWFIGGEPTTIIPLTPFLSNRNSTSAQVGGCDASGTLLTGTVDTSVATTILFKLENQHADDDCRLQSLTVKRILQPA